MQVSDIKVFPVNSAKIKANGEFVLDKAVKIKFTLIQGQDGLFVGLPSETYTDKKDGSKKWSKKVEFLSKSLQKQVEEAVIEAYNNPKAKSEGTSSDSKGNLPTDF